MQFHQAANDRQAEPETVVRAVAAARRAHERHERAFEQRSIHADAGVGDLDDGVA
jgi:hypothetical protein